MTKDDKGGKIIAFLPAVQDLLRRRKGFGGFREIIQKEQLPLDAYDALAAEMRQELEEDSCMILFPVPKGIVSVVISKPGVTSDVAAGALALIRDGIRQNGIPKDALVQLIGFVNMRGPEQGEMKGTNKVAEIQEEQQRTLDGLGDGDLEGLLAEGNDTRMIVVPVPDGVVSVTILGPEVTPAVAVAALVLISEGIRENGIPEAPLLQLGGLVNIALSSRK